MTDENTNFTGAIKHLRSVLAYAEQRTCLHEETHRGGAIWEICDSCGKKWADDEGGKPADAHEYPKVISDAQDFLHSLKTDDPPKPPPTCPISTGQKSPIFSCEMKGAKGRLFAKDGKLHFEGDLDESAKMFFAFVCKQVSPSNPDLLNDLKTALDWIDDGVDQEGRDLIVWPMRAKYFQNVRPLAPADNKTPKQNGTL